MPYHCIIFIRAWSISITHFTVYKHKFSENHKVLALVFSAPEIAVLNDEGFIVVKLLNNVMYKIKQ